MVNTQDDFAKGSSKSSNQEKQSAKERESSGKTPSPKYFLGKPKKSIVDEDLTQPPDEEKERAQTPANTIVPSVNADASPSRCFICTKSLLMLSVEERQQHVNACLDKMNDKDDKEDADFQKPSVFKCTICSRDITKLSSERREQHTNTCIGKQLDKAAKKSKSTGPTPATTIEEHIVLGNDISSVSSLTTVEPGQAKDIDNPQYRCPLCKRDLSKRQLKARISHLKDCAKKTGASPGNIVAVPETIKIVKSKFFNKKQEEDTQDGLLDTLAKHRPAELKTSGKKRKVNTTLLQEENEDEALLMAMAMSRSEQDHPEAVSLPILSQKPPVQKSLFGYISSSAPKPKSKIIENLFSKQNEDDEISSTPRFAESALTKKYQTSKQSLLQQQEAARWKAPVAKINSPKKPTVQTTVTELPKDLPKDQNDTRLRTDQTVTNKVSPVKPTKKPQEPSEKEPVTNEEENSKSDSGEEEPNEGKNAGPLDKETWQTVLAESKDILTQYREKCKERHDIFLQRMKDVKRDFFADVGKLTIAKDTSLQELYRKYNLSPNASILVELPLYFNIQNENSSEDEAAEQNQTEDQNVNEDPEQDESKEEDKMEEVEEKEDSLISPPVVDKSSLPNSQQLPEDVMSSPSQTNVGFNLATTPPKKDTVAVGMFSPEKEEENWMFGGQIKGRNTLVIGSPQL